MFNTFCWYLNVLHLSWVAAGLRFVLAVLFKRLTVERFYDHPTAGYDGWLWLPYIGCLAFRRTNDQQWQYRW